MTDSYTHFKDKDAIGHVVQAQAKGVISAAEIHGIETPGYISAAADSARDIAVIFLLFLPLMPKVSHLAVFFLGYIAWRTGRAAWLGWARLERLHRVLEQERWEIEHNRSQEKDELRELYRAKGFEGKLLEDVLGVLMADGDRLLRVMIEEELGLSLENVEHPLKQGFGAGLGALSASVLLLLGLYLGLFWGSVAIALVIIGIAAALLASFSQNRLIPAITWNIALGLLSFGLTYFTLQLVA
jgi:hypothetical protein